MLPGELVSPDKFKDISLYVIDTVVPKSKMLPHIGGTLRFYYRSGFVPVGTMFYIIEMLLEPHFDGIARLAYILRFADLASDQIDQIVEFASVYFCGTL